MNGTDLSLFGRLLSVDAFAVLGLLKDVTMACEKLVFFGLRLITPREVSWLLVKLHWVAFTLIS